MFGRALAGILSTTVEQETGRTPNKDGMAVGAVGKFFPDWRGPNHERYKKY